MDALCIFIKPMINIFLSIILMMDNFLVMNKKCDFSNIFLILTV